MKRFWISAVVFFAAINTLTAVLYAEIPAINNGSGFISFSPFADCVFWGVIIAVAGLIMLISFRASRPRVPQLPQSLHFPAAYIATLALMSVLILLMGMCQLLYEFSPIHLPLLVYASIIVLLYLVCGIFAGSKYSGSIWCGLLWGFCIAVLLVSIGSILLQRIQIEDAPWQLQIENGSYGPGYTGRLMNTSLGGVLGRINLPACVVMGNYEYAYYDNLGGCHHIPLSVMTILVCLLPPMLFTAGWLVGIRLKKTTSCAKHN